MVVSGSDAPAVFHAIEETLDFVAGGVEGLVNRMLDAAVLLRGYLGGAAAGADLIAYGIAVIAPIA